MLFKNGMLFFADGTFRKLDIEVREDKIGDIGSEAGVIGSFLAVSGRLQTAG